jgi:hypothetical protein
MMFTQIDLVTFKILQILDSDDAISFSPDMSCTSTSEGSIACRAAMV